MVWRRLSEHANSLIAALLAAFGLAAMHWPDSIGDKSAAATLAGALFGAAALFAGSEINQWRQQLAEKNELEERQRKVRSALGPEFARICMNIGSFAHALAENNELFRAALVDHKDEEPKNFNLLLFVPPEALVFDQLSSEALVLPESEIDAIM
jgi:hypothetical protein